MLIISILSTFLLQTVFDNPFTIKLPILMYNILIHFIFLFFLRSLVGSLKWELSFHITYMDIWHNKFFSY